MTEQSADTNNDITSEHWEHRKHRILFGIIVLILLFIVFMFGMAAGRVSRNFYVERSRNFNNMRGLNGFGWQSNSTFMSTPPSSMSNQLEITGVVTEINGDKVTVVGGGTSNIVTTNSSTQYIGASSLAVNDTVSIVGQYNNNTLTATSITIN